jgi:hypothetical protein
MSPPFHCPGNFKDFLFLVYKKGAYGSMRADDNEFASGVRRLSFYFNKLAQIKDLFQ